MSFFIYAAPDFLILANISPQVATAQLRYTVWQYKKTRCVFILMLIFARPKMCVFQDGDQAIRAELQS